MKNFLINIFVMNLIFVGLIALAQYSCGFVMSIDRTQALILTFIAWNFILIKCYRIRASEKRHLIFMSLFPLKLLVVAMVFYLSQNTLRQEDTAVWILIVIIKFFIAEVYTVKTLVKTSISK
jgi:hypothetical protein